MTGIPVGWKCLNPSLPNPFFKISSNADSCQCLSTGTLAILRLLRYLNICWKLQAVKIEASITAPFSLLYQQEDGQEWFFSFISTIVRSVIKDRNLNWI